MAFCAGRGVAKHSVSAKKASVIGEKKEERFKALNHSSSISRRRKKSRRRDFPQAGP